MKTGTVTVGTLYARAVLSRALMWVLLGACSFNPTAGIVEPPVGDGPSPDVPVGELHLAITEICVEGTTEFIEIHNPTAVDVDLSTYYVTDSNDYWKLPAGPAMVTVVGSDFLVKFPAGATLAAGGTLVIATDGPAFETAFGTPATFAIATMTEVKPPDQPVQPTKLTDDGELLVLFEWDGARDLVRDVDIVVHGRPTSGGNQLVAKAPVDGPDADATATAYAEDARTMMMTARGPDNDQFSYKRIVLEGTGEATGGNGITGHDETSEDLTTTWDLGSTPRTPGVFAPL